MNFVELSKIAAYGPLAFGKDKVCPRDGVIDCSIVDGVREDGYSGKATFFLSWVWVYTWDTVIAALQFFVKSQPQGFDPTKHYLWWCFFVNNQFRILEAKQHQSFDSLQETFKTQLQEAGHMLCMFDKVSESGYAQRLWCIFEILKATEAGIPMEVILPESVADDVFELIRQGRDVASQTISIHSEAARATSEEDQENIRNLIQTTTSYQAVNATVQKALLYFVHDVVYAEKNNPVLIPIY